MMRSIGMDVHRSFAQVAICDDGQITDSFKVDMEHDAVVEFGRSLRADDEVVLEATGNTATIVRLLTPFVARVVIANPLQVKAIAHARVKTDKVDAKILAQLHAAGFLPEVWAADDETLALRRLVSERAAVVRSIRRSKSRVQAVLHANLIPKEAYPSEPGLTTCWVCGCRRQDVRLMFCHAQPLEIRPPDVPRRLRGALSR